jgi:single-strand DNA-binding protein
MKGENMLNQIVIVGRLVRDPELRETDNGKKITNVTLAVPRSYKNLKGEYETDFIDCVLWTGIAENTVEYCKKGDLLGIKGRVQTRIYETEDEKKRHVTEVVAEKVTFLSPNRN